MKDNISSGLHVVVNIYSINENKFISKERKKPNRKNGCLYTPYVYTGDSLHQAKELAQMYSAGVVNMQLLEFYLQNLQ